MKIHALQIEIAWEDPAANHAHVEALLAADPPEAGALVILPEMFDVGFSMNVEATAQPEDRPTETFLKKIAAEHRVAVLAGIVGPATDGKATNEAVAFDPDGNELVRYQKMQPFNPSGEGAYYPAGNTHRLFEWGGARIAPFICYDLRFPEIFRPAGKEGADLIAVIANWPSRRSDHWVALLRARAIESQAYAIGVNRCGNDPQLGYDGRSVLFDPQGVSQFEADGREQAIKQEIDPAVARSWKQEFPILDDMR